jgi:uncharacterized membrane protein
MHRYILKTIWALVIILALMVGYIPIAYLMNGVEPFYLELKTPETLKSMIWWSFLYAHIISGGIAILIGWVQFNKYLQTKRTQLHRTVGKIYLAAALACAVSGSYISFHATGGWLSALGFLTVSVLYFYTTLKGFTTIRNGQLAAHQDFMTYSYALCLSAVTLRLAVPFSYLFTDDYVFSYSIIAWAAWMPNLLIAYWVNKNRERSNTGALTVSGEHGVPI